MHTPKAEEEGDVLGNWDVRHKTGMYIIKRKGIISCEHKAHRVPKSPIGAQVHPQGGAVHQCMQNPALRMLFLPKWKLTGHTFDLGLSLKKPQISHTLPYVDQISLELLSTFKAQESQPCKVVTTCLSHKFNFHDTTDHYTNVGNINEGHLVFFNSCFNWHPYRKNCNNLSNKIYKIMEIFVWIADIKRYRIT